MCTTHLDTYVYPDGHHETVSRPSLCPSACHGQPCSRNVFFHHAAAPVPYAHPPAPPFYSAPYLGRFPPSPSYSPRLSASSLGSVDASDRPLGSPGHDGRRMSSSYAGRHGEQRAESSGRPRRDRPGGILVADSHPASRAPSQGFAFPSTAPSSPAADTSPASRRRMIVDEPRRHDRSRNRSRSRSRVRIDIFDGPRPDKHTRREHHEASGEQDRLRRLRAKIAKANAEIDSRSPVPDAPVRPASRAARDREEELLDAVRRLDMEERAREDRNRLAQWHDEEARRRRLLQRMAPRPTATPGLGTRRHGVEFDDGVFRRG
ncbi:hypothetical protein E4U42_006303 [Claviceps africana]|uniref:Uncharacterized protein n=1 Tax=Claviceps africana TaxID=83212 RepID=A0A8K0J5D2_9HYPO|nr:hypothetical protein E4U42_006303 [Claviceps africana]